MGPKILRTRVESQVDGKSAFTVVFSVAFFPLDWTSSRWHLPFYWGSLLPVKYRRELLLVFKSFYPPQVKEDNLVA